MSKYPSQTQDKFTVRFPDGMRDLLAARAAENGRSMNSEIVQILEDALSPISKPQISVSEDSERVTLTQKQLNKIAVDLRDTLIGELNKKFNITPRK